MRSETNLNTATETKHAAVVICCPQIYVWMVWIVDFLEETWYLVLTYLQMKRREMKSGPLKLSEIPFSAFKSASPSSSWLNIHLHVMDFKEEFHFQCQCQSHLSSQVSPVHARRSSKCKIFPFKFDKSHFTSSDVVLSSCGFKSHQLVSPCFPSSVSASSVSLLPQCSCLPTVLPQTLKQPSV